MSADVLSLFAGIGGFDLAYKRAGATIVGHAEIDERCAALLADKFPGVPLTKDVRDVNACAGDADIIVGGFPCQDVSVAGRRAGLAGERSGLWHEYARIVESARPRWVVVENVAGLLSSNGGADFGTVLGALVELGYGVAWRVLDAQFFGVPQRRRRVFIVGHRGDARRAGEVLLEPGGGSWNPPARVEQRASIAGGAREGITDGGGSLTAPAPLLSETGVVSALSARMGTSGHGDLANAQAGWLLPVSFNQRAEGRTREVHGSLSASKSATQYDGVLDADRIRQLTPLECERLQGFPDEWTAGFPNSTRYKMLGNAVAVPVVEWIARRMLAIDGA